MQIFCDMDEVLVDFTRGVRELIEYYLSLATPNPKTHKDLLIQKALDELISVHKATRITNKMFDQTKTSKIRDLMLYAIANSKTFWENLPWTSQGPLLWNAIKQYNPIILSVPMNHYRSYIGKTKWVREQLGQNIRLILTGEASSHSPLTVPQKFTWATGPDCILIDDWPVHTRAWEKAGGSAILHAGDMQATITALHYLINTLEKNEKFS